MYQRAKFYLQDKKTYDSTYLIMASFAVSDIDISLLKALVAETFERIL